MTIGPISTDGASAQQVQPQSPQQDIRQEEQQQRSAELESPAQTSENAPVPNSRVGSIINTQA